MNIRETTSPKSGANRPALMPNAGRGITAVLGPTNTGKTHLAIERMIAHSSGVIGLPLRLLAREVYGRIVDQLGASQVALVTGEEKIIPKTARFQVCTVEAMPQHADVAFVAIDEAQLAGDLERGHIFTDRILNLRGREETMLLGASTLRPVLDKLLPGINIISRPRMSALHYAGSKKITRLPRRSAIVAFSSDEVYAIAELIRRQRGGAAVVLGSLSPRTRNAQVALYQSGDVDFLVATDAIGMGLNLDVDHVAFSQDHKFDGYQRRRLTPAELAQIAGRAGRHINDGTFGVTGNLDSFEDPLVQALEAHEFPPLKTLQWRNRRLDFSTIDNLRASLELPPTIDGLVRSPPAIDVRTLEALAREAQIRDVTNSPESVEQLWDVCQVPDYRRIAPANHAGILSSIYLDLRKHGKIDENWFADQIRRTDDTNGNIDAISNRIAHIRTWTYVSNRENWLADPQHWQENTREIENRLSDALHENLTKRFVDRRTSVLMKRLRENAMLEAEISPTGDVTVEGHHVGQLLGFRFTADKTADGPDAKAARNAAEKALAAEIESRSEKLNASANSDFVLSNDATIRWNGEPVAKIIAGEETLKPRTILLADEQLTGAVRDKVEARINRWLSFHLETNLKPLIDLATAEELTGLARGLAYQLYERLGTIPRNEVADEVKKLDQDTRATLRRRGVRFGFYHIFVPVLLKPAPVTLLTFLWALKNDKLDAPGFSEIPQLNAAGRTSVAVDPEFEKGLYPIAGFRLLGPKAVRVDILERLADLIRPAMMWRGNEEPAKPAPDGAVPGSGFVVSPAMLSILGASHEDMAIVLKELGYRGDVKPAEEVEAILASIHPQTAKTEPESASKTATSPQEDAKAETGSDAEPKSETDPVSKDASAPEKESKPEEAKTTTIWRQQRQAHQNRPHQNRGKQGGKPDNRAGGKPSAKGKPGQSGEKKFQKPKSEKPLDPDSPFAKLAALKNQMQGKK